MQKLRKVKRAIDAARELSDQEAADSSRVRAHGNWLINDSHEALRESTESAPVVEGQCWKCRRFRQETACSSFLYHANCSPRHYMCRQCFVDRFYARNRDYRCTHIASPSRHVCHAQGPLSSMMWETGEPIDTYAPADALYPRGSPVYPAMWTPQHSNWSPSSAPAWSADNHLYCLPADRPGYAGQSQGYNPQQAYPLPQHNQQVYVPPPQQPRTNLGSPQPQQAYSPPHQHAYSLPPHHQQAYSPTTHHQQAYSPPPHQQQGYPISPQQHPAYVTPPSHAPPRPSSSVLHGPQDQSQQYLGQPGHTQGVDTQPSASTTYYPPPSEYPPQVGFADYQNPHDEAVNPWAADAGPRDLNMTGHDDGRSHTYSSGHRHSY